MSESFWKRVIERAVRRSTGAASIVDLELLQPVWGGNGEVLRAELSGGAVPSVIVKKVVPPATKKKRADRRTARTIASYDNELCFYREHAGTLPPEVRLPRLFHGERLAEGWLFILEDLAQSGFMPASAPLSESQLRAGLAWLAGFHAQFLGSSGAGLWKAGSYWNLAVRGDERARMTDSRLADAAPALDRAMNSATYKTVIHGDAKVDNLCFSTASAAGIDFQHTGLGCGMKDVMCLFDSCLSPFEASSLAPDLLDEYFQQLRIHAENTPAAVDVKEVEAEWRELYPVAWADYYRFLDGWAPGKYPPVGYVDDMTRLAFRFIDAR